ncbi:MAG: alpha-amylase family glycosyl hydrolase, partial [Gemmiger sp.]
MTPKQIASLPCYAGGDLGAVWSASQTSFKLWAPTARKVGLHLYATGTDDEPGARELGVFDLAPAGDGVWQVVVPGNLHGLYYTYSLRFAGGKSTVVVDPYARAAGANGERGMVIDLTAAEPKGWREDTRPVIPAHARCVWEGHVGDFSADAHSGVPEVWRGKYMAFTLADTTLDQDGVHPTCLNYLKRLGVTHLQLQPIFDYATVDETRPGGYNWGYDPLNYNVPEGSFATDAFHGAVRVRECRAMVQAVHRAGLGVVMDVVYNH